MTLRQAPTRHVTVVIAVLACTIAGLGFLFLSSWMGALTPAPPMATEELRITDVQFGTGCMTLTANNTGDRMSVRISEIMVSEINPANSILPKVPEVNATLNELVPPGEHVAIIVCYEWVSGSIYRIILTSERGNYFTDIAVAP